MKKIHSPPAGTSSSDLTTSCSQSSTSPTTAISAGFAFLRRVLEGASIRPLRAGFWRAGGVSPLFGVSNRGLTPPARRGGSGFQADVAEGYRTVVALEH